MRDPETLLKYLPLFSIGGLLVSVFYVNGYFWYLGRQWVSSLTISEYIALCLPVLPGLLMGVLVGMVSWEDPMWAKMDRDIWIAEQNRKEREAVERGEPVPRPPKRSRATESLAFLGVFFSFALYNLVKDNVPVAYVYWSVGLAIFATLALAVWFFIFSVFRDWVWGLAALVAFGVASVTYSYGQVQGAAALTRTPTTEIRFVDGTTECVAIVMFMNDGPLFSTDSRTTRFSAWSSIAHVTTNTRCRQSSSPHA